MTKSGKHIVATNRQAKREFEIFDTIEAGMVLKGSEVKSLRNAQAQLAEAFCRIHKGEIWLNSCHITKMYFKNGKAKVELGLARRKNLVDKRRQLAQREAEREATRAIARQQKQGPID